MYIILFGSLVKAHARNMAEATEQQLQLSWQNVTTFLADTNDWLLSR